MAPHLQIVSENVVALARKFEEENSTISFGTVLFSDEVVYEETFDSARAMNDATGDMWMALLRGRGGGDMPEAGFAALRAAHGLAVAKGTGWHPSIIYVSDAPAHNGGSATLPATRDYTLTQTKDLWQTKPVNLFYSLPDKVIENTKDKDMPDNPTEQMETLVTALKTDAPALESRHLPFPVTKDVILADIKDAVECR